MDENPYQPSKLLAKDNVAVTGNWTHARVCRLAAILAIVCPGVAVLIGVVDSMVPGLDGTVTLATARLVLVFGHACAVVGFFATRRLEVAISVLGLMCGLVLSYVFWAVTVL